MTKKKAPPAKLSGESSGAVAQPQQTVQTDRQQTPAPSPVSPAVMTPAVEAAGLENLRKLMKSWHRRHRRPPAVLYHYTNAQGLHGMISTGRVWGTNVGFLNDPSEMRYAARLIRNVMAKEVEHLTANQQPADEKKSILRNAVQAYASAMSKSLPTWTETLLKSFEDQGDAYMTCFCTKGDLLSQWRGYGSTGGGYALGFGAAQIGVPAEPAGGVLLRRVIYEPKEQEGIIRNWVRAFFDLGHSLVEAMREEASEGTSATNVVLELFTLPGAALGIMKRAVTNKQLLEQGQQVFTKFLAECLICFKDPAYQEEQEWRVIQFGQNVPEIKFRPSGPRLVPYVELALTPPTDNGAAAPLPLKSITYGPTLEPAVTEKSLAMLLKHYKYVEPAIEIKRSGIPFRT